MATAVETKADAQLEGGIAHVDHGSFTDEKKGNVDKAGAIEAENAEHEMGVLDAVRAYPMATWWAFVMSCTIVSLFLLPFWELTLIFTMALELMQPIRSWSPTVSFS